jgi:3-hydroxyphenylacetate 6-hydroxylase
MLHLLDTETQVFLQDCLKTGPGAVNPVDMLDRLSTSLNFSYWWGREVALAEPLCVTVNKTERDIMESRNLLSNFKDAFPFLRLLWSTKQTRQLRIRRDAYVEELNVEFEQKMSRGSSCPCLRSEFLSRQDVPHDLLMNEIAMLDATIPGTGIAPTTTSLYWGLALFASRPEIQEQCYRATCQHYGGETYPLGDIEDDQGCEYVVAVIQEILRYMCQALSSNLMLMMLADTSLQPDWLYRALQVKTSYMETLSFLKEQ